MGHRKGEQHRVSPVTQCREPTPEPCQEDRIGARLLSCGPVEEADYFLIADWATAGVQSSPVGGMIDSPRVDGNVLAVGRMICPVRPGRTARSLGLREEQSRDHGHYGSRRFTGSTARRRRCSKFDQYSAASADLLVYSPTTYIGRSMHTVQESGTCLAQGAGGLMVSLVWLTTGAGALYGR